MRTLKVLVIVGCCALGAACGGSKPGEPGDVADAAHGKLAAMVDDAVAMVSSLSRSDYITTMNQPTQAVAVAFGGSFYFPVPGVLSATNVGQNVGNWLSDHVFSQANYEGDGWYLVHGSAVCGADATCAANVDAAVVRLHVELSSSDGLTATAKIGPAGAEVSPFTLVCHDDQIVADVDLVQARQAWTRLAPVFPQIRTLPDVTSGKLHVEIHHTGAQHFTASLSLPEAIHATGSSSSGAYDLATAARDPALTVDADGVALRVGLTLDLGATSAHFPWNSVFTAMLTSGASSLTLAGLGVRATLDGTAHTAALRGLTLGGATAKLSLGSEVIVAADLAPLDLTVTPAAPGLPTVTLSPSFDATVTTHLAPLTAAGDTVNTAVADEVYHLTTQGLTQPIAGPPSSALRVTAALVLTAAKWPASITVPAGQCLYGNNLAEPTANPWIGKLVGRVCP